MASAPRILLVKTSSLGDVIHALPVVTDIVRAQPGATIDWVAEESFADIPRLHPAVGTIFRTALRRWKKQLLAAETRQEIGAFRCAISAPTYDHIIDLQGLVKSAWISRQATGVRSGFDFRSAREGWSSLAYQHRFAVDRAQHAVHRNRQLAASALGYSLDRLSLDYGIGNPAKRPPGIDLQNSAGNATFALLITATSRDDKLWPEDRWIALGLALGAQGMNAILPAGSAVERARADRIAAQIPGARVLAPATIAQLASEFSTSRLAIGVDTGLTHLACALGLPTLALFTATDPGLTGVIGSGFFRNLGGKANTPTVDEVLRGVAAALS